MSGSTATLALGQFAAETGFAALPDAVVRESERAILDFFGVALGGADSEPARLSRSLSLTLGGEPQATILRFGDRTSTAGAALVNGVMANVMDFDDTHVPTILHPTSPMMAAALAVGEWKRSTGKELLAAYGVGYELAARVSLAMSPESYDAGWHLTGTTGTIGAAVAAGKLLGLDARHMAWAIGLAATQAAGSRQQFGEMAKSLHAGRAASNGIAAALLASEGFTASDQSIEGPLGMLRLMGGGDRGSAHLLDGLGQRWEIFRNGLKPYACGIVAHPAVDVVRELAEQHSLSAEEIDRIELAVHPLALALTGRRNPRTGLEAKFSLYFACAAFLLQGAAGKRQFTDQNVHQADIRHLMDRISATEDQSLRHIEAEGTAFLKDGRSVTAHVHAATGTPEHPMPDADLDAKVRELAAPEIGVEGANQLIALVRRLPSLVDVGELARATLAV